MNKELAKLMLDALRDPVSNTIHVEDLGYLFPEEYGSARDLYEAYLAGYDWNERHKYDDRHGGPFDRGAADSWYSRPRDPHYFEGGTYETPKIMILDRLSPEYKAYMAGYDWNERHGGKKDWG